MAGQVLLQSTDYVVATAMLAVPVIIGVYFAIKDSKKATRDEYLLGGGRMAMLPVTLSIFVTFVSAIALVGAPADIYYFGTMAAFVFPGFSLSYLVGLFTLVPLLYPLHLTSLYQYLMWRFESRAVRVTAVSIGMLQTTCYMAIALLGPALSLQAAACIPLWTSVALVGVIGTFYTALGGIKSVVWTDAYQSLVMFIGMAAIIVKGIMATDGPGAIVKAAQEGGRLSFDRLNLDPRVRFTWWSAIFGGLFSWLPNIFNQSMIQRVCSMKTMADAKKAFIWNIPILTGFGGLLCICGIVMYGYFHVLRCDPFQAGFIASKNQLTPFYALHILEDLPGMSGFYMATLFSGGLSTLSSGINALAANTVEDFLQKPLSKLRESTATLITKLVVCLYGFLIIGLSYLASSLTGPITQMSTSIFGACGGPIVGIFFLGASYPRANKYGALVGILSALVLNIWMAVGNQMYGRKVEMMAPPSTDTCHLNSSTDGNYTRINLDYSGMLAGNSNINETFTNTVSLATQAQNENPYAFGFFLYDISFEWYGFVGAFISFTVGALFSIATSKWTKDRPSSKLIFPFARRLWSLPQPQGDGPFFSIKGEELSKILTYKVEVPNGVNNDDKRECANGFQPLLIKSNRREIGE